MATRRLSISNLFYLAPNRIVTLLLGATSRIIPFRKKFVLNLPFATYWLKNGMRLMMKAKWTTLLAGIGVLTMILLTGHPPVGQFLLRERSSRWHLILGVGTVALY